MYAIENDLGRFEADTEREAKKLLRAALKKNQVEMRLKAKHRKIASDRAKATAFDVMNRFLEGKDCPSGWRYYKAGSRFAAKSTQHPTPVSSYPRSTVRVRTPHGEIEIEDWYVRLIGSVVNGACHDILLYVDNGDCEQCLAVGVCEGVWAAEEVYGIRDTWFIGGQNDA